MISGFKFNWENVYWGVEWSITMLTDIIRMFF